MRILFLTTAHNSLSQRAQIDLIDHGHEVSVELALSDAAMIQAAETYQPDLILAPMLKKAIPEQVWRRFKCLIVHPGIRGDRGPSSLDWAISDSESSWGVTLLEAIEEMDAGDIWATREFPVRPRPVSKSSLYRNEITEVAMRAIRDAVERFQEASFVPAPLDYSTPETRGRERPVMKQTDRSIDWTKDSTASVIRKIRAADSSPGVLDVIADNEFYLFGAHEEDRLRGTPGALIAQRHGAVCRATVDGAIWLSHLKRRPKSGQKTIKLPATQALGDLLGDLPVSLLALDAPLDHRSFRDIHYAERGGAGFLYFDFYNGAMSTDQCERLREAFVFARSRPTRVIVLMGGADFFSNGIHLNVIEAAANPADESWHNIIAIDDFVKEVLTTTSHLIVSAIRGNAGAGGVMMALAADEVWARHAVVLNPHYKSMGGLYGSEYWTYSLPRRVGPELARELTDACLPIGARRARTIGLIDHDLHGEIVGFAELVMHRAGLLARDPQLPARLEAKRARRERDEQAKPLEAYRAEELACMHRNFYGPDSGYHDARRRFVYKEPATATPAHLALHRAMPDSSSTLRTSTTT